ncbi:hypothetical protein B0A50_07396 [Salinomyces thailandicus]|uniref:Uncharacterized protein n=1 Tax=Salinomyces thailandicus TaxID=706561 RepID=A0A4V5N3C8_9PEZI|nr:hypothetical protein B0A50_07396 [Salinomyces thailandica]
MASSASKLIPSDPEKVMVIRHIDPSILTCSVPFQRFSRIKIGGRGTIVRLATGNLAVFSPVALTPTLQKTLSELGTGEVRYITALDQEHHIFLEPWHKAFPNARVLAPETLPEYRKKQDYFPIPKDNWILYPQDRSKGPVKVSEEFDAEFESEYVSAHANQELVFHHKPTKTLIEADLLFNLPATEQFSKTDMSATSGLLTRLMCGINSTAGDATWQRRFIWYAISAGNRQAFNESIARIDKWGFEKLVPCHGDVVEEGGKGVFRKVMQWHLEAVKKQG